MFRPVLSRVAPAVCQAQLGGALTARWSSSVTDEVKQLGVVGLGLMGEMNAQQGSYNTHQTWRHPQHPPTYMFSGHGIAQVAAQNGFKVVAIENNDEAVARGVGMIRGSLETIAKRSVKQGKMEEVQCRAIVQQALEDL